LLKFIDDLNKINNNLNLLNNNYLII